jgi:hypothetical protein
MLSIALAPWTAGWLMSLSQASREESVRYLVPEMKDILRTLTASSLPGADNAAGAEACGYTLSEADLMRRAMGKKNVKKWRAQGEVHTGAVERE